MQPGSAEDQRRQRTVLAFVVAAVVLVAVPVAVSRLVGRPAVVEHTFEIPAGTAARLAAGEQVEVLPADLRLNLQDRLVVINRDDRAHQVGPFTVAPGERLVRDFAETVSFSGFCSLHPDGGIDINVRPAT